MTIVFCPKPSLIEYIFNIMINKENIKYDFTKCNPLEQEILIKYWDCNNEGKYTFTLTQILKEYDLKQSQLYSLAHKFSLEWDFGKCECGNPIKAYLSKRNELESCLKAKGSINIYGYDYYLKCAECNRIEAEKKMEEQLNIEDYSPCHPEINNDLDTSICNVIRQLSSIEIKLLFQIYKLRDFNLIKDSNEIFPIKHGEHKTFVWRTLYKFDKLSLISAEKDGSYIKTIHFFDNVSELLDHMVGELEPSIEYTDLELSLIKVLEGPKTKYFTFLEPETDIVLKAGNKYEFVASITTDKNVLLRVINLHSM